MLPSGGILEQARTARDPRFDGRFFIAVRTTGIYCRPVCPVKMPRPENVVFFETAAAASEAGFRPCLRCRPEASPGTPAWKGTSATVSRALKLINDGALDEGSVAKLSDRLGVTSRHLGRLFTKHLGASPKTVAQTRRMQFAKKLIDETSLPMTTVALSSGYGSIRRFNDHFNHVYGRSPTSLRRERGASPSAGIELKLAYRQPYDFESLLNFFKVRAVPGVEDAVDGSYRRNFMLDGVTGSIEVRASEAGTLQCSIKGGDARSLLVVIDRVRRMFDLDALPSEVNEQLMADRLLRPLVRKRPGLRLPGAFDSFETAIRAIVGQQVSVRGATTVMGRISEMYGDHTSECKVFPGADVLADIDPGSLPMPGRRALAIRELSRQVADGRIRLDVVDDELQGRLLSIPGIGPWTAQYIALRVGGDPDAFLHGDLVLKKAAEKLLGTGTEKSLLERAEAWRPWRGYAGLHLWRYAADNNL